MTPGVMSGAPERVALTRFEVVFSAAPDAKTQKGRLVCETKCFRCLGLFLRLHNLEPYYDRFFGQCFLLVKGRIHEVLDSGLPTFAHSFLSQEFEGTPFEG